MMVAEIVIVSVAGMIAAAARSISGWAEKSAEEKQWITFDYLKLTQTIIRIGLLNLTIWLTANYALGIDAEVFATGAAAFLTDKLFHALKNQ